MSRYSFIVHPPLFIAAFQLKPVTNLSNTISVKGEITWSPQSSDDDLTALVAHGTAHIQSPKGQETGYGIQLKNGQPF